MKKLSLVTLLFAFLLMTTISSGCIGHFMGVDGNGNVIKKERDISSFNAIDVGGAFEIEIRQGESVSLTLETDENLHELIVTEVRSGTLEVYTKEDVRKFEKMKLYITITDLKEMDLSGAVEIYTVGMLDLSELFCDVSGAIEIDMNIKADELTIDASGASEVNLTGYVESVRVEISGAGELDAIELETEYFSLDISGAGDAKIFVNKELEIEASGASNVRYKGNPEVVNHSSSGASSVKKI
jgi:hypothetical protein